MQPLFSVIVAILLVLALAVPAYAALRARLAQSLSSRDLNPSVYYPVTTDKVVLPAQSSMKWTAIFGELGFPALDAASKDAAKMTIGTCSHMVVTATTPSGVERAPASGQWGHCVYSMKVPSGVPLTMNVEIVQALGVAPAAKSLNPNSMKFNPNNMKWKIQLEPTQMVQDKWKVVSSSAAQKGFDHNYIAGNQINLIPGANLHIPFSAYEWIK